MSSERLNELAALHALDFLDEAEKKELLNSGEDELIRDFAETAALLAYDAPEVPPSPALKAQIMGRLPKHRAPSRIIAFTQWMPYAIAACLMVLGIVQAQRIFVLKAHVRQMKAGLLADDTEVNHLRTSNALKDLRLAMLQEGAAAQANAAYASSHIMVAWDPAQHRGMLSMKNLPSPPTGHVYQLWVLDPKAQKPISAGLINESRPFAVEPVSTSQPGFAISLEPSGGMPAPTGPILFAVAPGQ